MCEPADDASEPERELVLAELAYHRQRLASSADMVISIGNFIFLLVSAGVLAASRIPAVFVAVPLVWTAWLFVGLQLAWDSMKHETFAVWLEERVAALVPGLPTARWNSIAANKQSVTPLVTTVNFGYWVFLHAVSWAVGVVLLFREGLPLFAALALAVWVASYGLAVGIIRQRPAAVERLRSALNDTGGLE